MTSGATVFEFMCAGVCTWVGIEELGMTLACWYITGEPGWASVAEAFRSVRASTEGPSFMETSSIAEPSRLPKASASSFTDTSGFDVAVVLVKAATSSGGVALSAAMFASGSVTSGGFSVVGVEAMVLRRFL